MRSATTLFQRLGQFQWRFAVVGSPGGVGPDLKKDPYDRGTSRRRLLMQKVQPRSLVEISSGFSANCSLSDAPQARDLACGADAHLSSAVTCAPTELLTPGLDGWSLVPALPLRTPLTEHFGGHSRPDQSKFRSCIGRDDPAGRQLIFLLPAEDPTKRLCVEHSGFTDFRAFWKCTKLFLES